MFSNAEVSILLVDENGREYKYDYNIGDIIKFNG